MKASVKLLVAASLAVPLTLGLAGVGFAKDASESSKAQKARGPESGENIKNRSPKNAPEAKAEAPAEKGGKSRGAVCKLHVDNRTPWKIQLFVDGDYVGLASSWGDAYGYYGCGTHTLYAVAEFIDGPDLTWGPISLRLPGTWTLNQ